MISACAPMFTVFFARFIIKEPILCIDILNVIFIIFGMVLIVKPPFLFGLDVTFGYETESLYALIALILSSIFIQPNVYVALRLLKGTFS